jgi:hypothetical protein
MSSLRHCSTHQQIQGKMLPAAEKDGNEAVEQRRLKDAVLRSTVTKVLAMRLGM